MDRPVRRVVPDGWAPAAEHVFCEEFVVEYALRAAQVDRYLAPPPWIRGGGHRA